MQISALQMLGKRRKFIRFFFLLVFAIIIIIETRSKSFWKLCGSGIYLKVKLATDYHRHYNPCITSERLTDYTKSHNVYDAPVFVPWRYLVRVAHLDFFFFLHLQPCLPSHCLFHVEMRTFYTVHLRINSPEAKRLQKIINAAMWNCAAIVRTMWAWAMRHTHTCTVFITSKPTTWHSRTGIQKEKV